MDREQLQHSVSGVGEVQALQSDDLISQEQQSDWELELLEQLLSAEGSSENPTHNTLNHRKTGRDTMTLERVKAQSTSVRTINIQSPEQEGGREGEEETPRSALSSSSSEYSNRSDSEAPLPQREANKVAHEEDEGSQYMVGAEELEDFQRIFEDMIGSHPSKEEPQTDESAERPKTPPGKSTVKPKDSSPRTRKRLENEAARGYPYCARPTRRWSPEEPDVWINEQNSTIFGPHAPSTPSGNFGAKKPEYIPSPLRTVHEDQKEDKDIRPGAAAVEYSVDRPLVREPTELSPLEFTQQPAVSTTNDESLARNSPILVTSPLVVDAVSDIGGESLDSALSWEDSKNLGRRGSAWDDEDEDEDWGLELERKRTNSISLSSEAASLRSSVPSVNTEILSKVDIMDDYTVEDVTTSVAGLKHDDSTLLDENMTNFNIEAATKPVPPIESETSPISVKVPESASPIVSEPLTPSEIISELGADQVSIEAQLVGEGGLFAIPTKPKPAVALPTSPHTSTRSTDVKTSPISPDSISPQSAASIEVLEQATNMTDQDVDEARDQLNEEIARLESIKPTNKDEGLAVLRMKRALMTIEEDEIQHKKGGPVKRIRLPPISSEERTRLVNDRAWDYRRQRNHLWAQCDAMQAHIDGLEIELNEYKDVVQMRNQAIAELKQKKAKLEHGKNVLEEELKWARLRCPVCSADLDDPDIDDADSPGSCRGRCKQLEKYLADEKYKVRQVEAERDEICQHVETTMTELTQKIAEGTQAVEAKDRQIKTHLAKIKYLQSVIRDFDDRENAIISKETQTEEAITDVDAPKAQYADANTHQTGRSQKPKYVDTEVQVNASSDLGQKDKVAAKLKVEIESKIKLLKTNDQEAAAKSEELEAKIQELKRKDKILEDLGARLETDKQDIAAKEDELSTKESEIRTKDRELATRKRLLEEKDEQLAVAAQEHKRLRNMLGEAIAIVTPTLNKQPEAPALVQDSTTDISITPLSPRSLPLPPSPMLPAPTPSRKSKSPMPSTPRVSESPTLSPVVERLPSPVFSPRSTALDIDGLEDGPAPLALPPHPTIASIDFQELPQSPLIQHPRQQRLPGWELREASWRNTDAYRNAMARFERKMAEQKDAEEVYEAMRQAAIENAAPGRQPMTRRDRLAVYTHSSKADFTLRLPRLLMV